jgi:hypothetical protein
MTEEQVIRGLLPVCQRGGMLIRTLCVVLQRSLITPDNVRAGRLPSLSPWTMALSARRASSEEHDRGIKREMFGRIEQRIASSAVAQYTA